MTAPPSPSQFSGKRVLVLGATGFIGRWVAKALCDFQAKVYLVARDASRARQLFGQYGIEGDLITLDLRDRQGLSEVCRTVRPEILFNLAGYGVDRSERSEALAHEINARLPESLAEIAARTFDRSWPGQQIVHVGSAAEYGDITGNLAEESLPHPTSLYGRTKLAGTEALKAASQRHGVRSTTGRPFTVYGPGEHPGRLLPSLLETARTQRPLELTEGLQRRDFVYVEDVAEALLRLGLHEHDSCPIANIATGRLTSVRDFTDMAAEVLAIPRRCLQYGALPTRAEEMEHDDVTIERLLRLTGWGPSTTIREGVRRTAYFEGYLQEGEKDSYV